MCTFVSRRVTTRSLRAGCGKDRVVTRLECTVNRRGPPPLVYRTPATVTHYLHYQLQLVTSSVITTTRPRRAHPCTSVPHLTMSHCRHISPPPGPTTATCHRRHVPLPPGSSTAATSHRRQTPPLPRVTAAASHHTVATSKHTVAMSHHHHISPLPRPNPTPPHFIDARPTCHRTRASTMVMQITACHST